MGRNRDEQIQMRALFLDFDGVLHPVSDIADWRELNLHTADLPTLIEERKLFRWLPHLVEALQEHEDVSLIVHSGWRGVADNMRLREILGPLGDRYIGITSRDLSRYVGIQEFALRAGLDAYAILDDATHEFPKGCAELLECHPERGIQDDEVLAKLRAWLDATSPTQSAAPAMAA